MPVTVTGRDHLCAVSAEMEDNIQESEKRIKGRFEGRGSVGKSGQGKRL